MLYKSNYKGCAIAVAIIFLNLSLLGCGGSSGSANNTTSSSAASSSSCRSVSSHDDHSSGNPSGDSSHQDDDSSGCGSTGGGGTTACTPPTTTGTPWNYSCEISVAKAYNTVFLTDVDGGVPYDEASKEGLAALIADHASLEPQTNWTAWHSVTSIQNPLTDVTNVSVLVADTSNQPTFGIKVGTTLIPIYKAGTWTPPSRGWINDPMGAPVTDLLTGQLISDWSTGVVSIPALLTAHGLPADSYFTFYVTNYAGKPVNMDISNTHRIEGNGSTNGGFLLAYEDGGGDGDYNEPIVYVNAPKSAPSGCFGLKPTILGTPNADLLIRGTLGNDVIMTFGGSDVIYASLGDDVICSGDGNDIVYGGGGKDIIFDDVGRNLLNGDVGDDTIYGGKERDVIFGGPGNDTIFGNGGGDVVYGDGGDDLIYAGAGNDVVLGLSGSDEIHGGDGNDRIFGDQGNDVLYGDGGDDRIYGAGGTNAVDGGVGANYCAPPLPNDGSTFVNCQ